MKTINTFFSGSGTLGFHVTYRFNGGKHFTLCTTITVNTLEARMSDSSLDMISRKSCDHSHNLAHPCYSCLKELLKEGVVIRRTHDRSPSSVAIQKEPNGNSTYLQVSDYPSGHAVASVPEELGYLYVNANQIPGCIYATQARSFRHPSYLSSIRDLGITPLSQTMSSLLFSGENLSVT